MASAGLAWDEVESMTWPQIEALLRYWRRAPPTHQLVAAYLGYEHREPTVPTEQDIEQLVSMVNGAQ